MPQKKNPDAAELLRAKAPRVVGDLSSFLGVLHALPLAYNKDMQEDKQYLFDSVDTLTLALAAASGMIEGAKFNREQMAEAAADGMTAATDLADLLVRRGVPFRQSHALVSTIVRETLAAGRELSSLTVEELESYSPQLDREAVALLAQDGWLESKASVGGTALIRVREQIVAARQLLS